MLVKITELRKLPRLHPHLLRHACATHLLDNGCPLDVISKVLGHDNIDNTAYYAQVSTRLMMRAYNGAHPHAQPQGKSPTAVSQPGQPRTDVLA